MGEEPVMSGEQVTPDGRNTPERLMSRAAMWIRLLCDVAEIEADETTIKVNLSETSKVRAGETVAEVRLSDDIAALEAAGGPAPMRPEDFDRVEALPQEEGA